MPKAFDKKSQELILSLISYFERERDNNGPFLPLTAVRERVADALNVSLHTVSNISIKAQTEAGLSSSKKRRLCNKPVTDIAKLETSSIRDQIYDMYKRKEIVNLSNIHHKLTSMELFEGSTASLHRVLRRIGFKWSKDDPRRGIMEQPHIVFKRLAFLRQYMEYKEKNIYSFAYLDETWIFQNGTTSHSWQDASVKSVKSTKVDGKRHIILHAGGRGGFIEGASLVFSSITTGDYHGEMNQENFLNWFTNFVKLLPGPTVIIMDNAPYHSTVINKCPTTNWKKADIQNWLKENKLKYLTTMFKAELLSIVNRNKPEKIYVADEIASIWGHVVLRLPPYHCIFNPIELVWGITKTYYNKHIGKDGNSATNCLDMWKKALETVTPEMWSNCVNHAEEEIRRWCEREHALEMSIVQPIVINVDNTDSEDDYYSDSDSENSLT